MTIFYGQKFLVCVTILFQTFENRIVVKRIFLVDFKHCALSFVTKKQLAIHYQCLKITIKNVSLQCSVHGKKNKYFFALLILEILLILASLFAML